MNFQDRNPRWAMLPERIRGMFNLNDPRWGRGEDKAEDGSRPESERPPAPAAGGVGVIPAPPGNRLIWMNCGATSTVSWAGCSATRTVARAVLVGAMEVGFNQT